MGSIRKISAIWYNNKWHGGTRNEVRLTGFGGYKSSVLDPENTGALVIFVFPTDTQGAVKECRLWICHDRSEEVFVESRIGPVEPGRTLIIEFSSSCRARPDLQNRHSVRNGVNPDEIPPNWIQSFPEPLTIMSEAVRRIPGSFMDPDRRLMERRDCEQDLYDSIENAFYFPRIEQGFSNMEEFREVAQSVLQRRKARSGRSLELHLKEIFREEGFEEDISFSYNKESDPGRKPDFLFPSADAYRNQSVPYQKLRMLAVKTTCKDRWRQILNEARHIPEKHLLTLQEGISLNQFREMQESCVRLVLPQKLIGKYNRDIRSKLQTLKDFIEDVQRISL